jgi:hypothetical protein
MGDINWFAGQGPKGPNSDVPKAQIIPAGTNKASEPNIWAGEIPKKAPVNGNIELSALDVHAGALSAAREAVMKGAELALVEVPKNIYDCQYQEAAGGIYQIMDGGRAIGYAANSYKR